MIACRIFGHAYRDGRVIRRANETDIERGTRVVFVILECLRCGHLSEGRRAEIDRLRFPDGISEWARDALEHKE